MKQVIQSYRNCSLQLVEVPALQLKPETLLVRTAFSLISIGTERCMLDLAKKSLAGKAMARPNPVKQVISKVQTEGLGEAWRR